MILHNREALLVQDKPFKYTAPCGIWDPGHSFFGQIANNTDSDTSNSDAQGQVNDNGQLHLTKPASLSPSLKRGWGRPRSEEKPKRKRRRAPARIAPKLQVPEESLRESNNQPIPLSDSESPIVEESFETLLVFSNLEWTTDGPYLFHHEMDISATGTPEQTTATVKQEANTAVMPRTSRLPRQLDVLIDPSREAIARFNILMTARDTSFWTDSSRVLLSYRLDYSYIYESYLTSLGYTCTPMPVRKAATHLGIFSPVSIVPIYVTPEPNGYDSPCLVDFHVLRGAPPWGGVDFMIGASALATIYGQNGIPNPN